MIHEGVVGLWVGGGDVDVFVHVEGYDVLEGDSSLVICLDEILIYQDRRGTGWEAEDERVLGCGVEVVDAV